MQFSTGNPQKTRRCDVRYCGLRNQGDAAEKATVAIRDTFDLFANRQDRQDRQENLKPDT